MDTSSPFVQHLDTNYAPTEGEAELLRHLIDDRKAQEDTLTTKIEEVEAALEAAMQEKQPALSAMKAERSALIKYTEDHTKLLSPIRRVPQDVLSIIFLCCIDDVEEQPLKFWGFELGVRPPRSFPQSVALSYVSRAWRFIALETPDLWSRIDAMIPDFKVAGGLDGEHRQWARDLGSKKSRIEAFTQRSLNRPIRLKLRNGETVLEVQDIEYGKAAQALYLSLVDAICASSSRWQDVELALTFDPVSQTLVRIFDRNPQELPLLRSITVGLSWDRYRQPSLFTVKCVGKMTSSGIFAAPSLRSVRIMGGLWCDIGKAKAASGVPIWDGITHLCLYANIAGELSSFGTPHALRVMGALPNLVECELKLAHGPGAFANPVKEVPISLPNLTKLILTSFPPAKGFAPSLDLPSLEALHLRSVYPNVLPQDEDANGIVELLE